MYMNDIETIRITKFAEIIILAAIFEKSKWPIPKAEISLKYYDNAFYYFACSINLNTFYQ